MEKRNIKAWVIKMSSPRRIYSIDVLRGLTISLMIIVNNPGSWASVYPPLLHAKWHGCTPTDLVFPFFLLIVGASTRFAFVKWHYYPSKEFHLHVFWRSLSIFLAGILLNAFPFIKQDWNWESFRFFGVLQRIAIAYGLSAILIIRYDFKIILKIITSILLFYWAALYFFNPVSSYSVETNLVRTIDIFLFGENHLYKGFGIAFDPEGLFSTIPAVATVLIGYLLGGMLHTTKNFNDCAKRMSILGLVLIVTGYLWGFILPINKPLWTSSYVLFTSGFGALSLSFLTYLIDIKGFKKYFIPFEIFGTNSIFLFLLSGLWTKTIIAIKLDLDGNLVSSYYYLYKTVFYPIFGSYNGSLVFALTHLLFFWLILFWMHQKKINIKL